MWQQVSARQIRDCANCVEDESGISFESNVAATSHVTLVSSKRVHGCHLAGGRKLYGANAGSEEAVHVDEDVTHLRSILDDEAPTQLTFEITRRGS